MRSYQDLQNKIAKWSDKTFGYDRNPCAPLAHLMKEVAETATNYTDIMEYADCMMLILDSARMAGHSATEILKATYKKLAINKKRKWGEPDNNGVVEHIRF
jgi:hypothetical protein